LGELLISVDQWEEGLEILNGLLADGALLGSKLAEYEKGAAMNYLLDGERELALKHLVRARNLGMPLELLGSGAAILAAATQEALGASREALSKGDFAAAEAAALLAIKYAPEYPAARVELGVVRGSKLVDEGLELLRAAEYLEAALRFESAIELDPDSLEAHTFLGSARFALEEFTRAAEAWHWVVDTARGERLELPEAVHLKLAQALLMAGSGADAKQVLADYLLLEPNGPWAEDTRRFQTQLADGGR
jgi:tetratricopeptide (TPR) repeat protein